MALLRLLLQLLLWAVGADALFIWEACRVDGTCSSPEEKTVVSRAGARRSQPLALGIHRHPGLVSSDATVSRLPASLKLRPFSRPATHRPSGLSEMSVGCLESMTSIKGAVLQRQMLRNLTNLRTNTTF